LRELGPNKKFDYWLRIVTLSLLQMACRKVPISLPAFVILAFCCITFHNVFYKHKNSEQLKLAPIPQSLQPAVALKDQYLAIVRNAVAGLMYPSFEKGVLVASFDGVDNIERLPLNMTLRATGLDWPLMGYTMIGLTRLDNIKLALETVIEQQIPGDFVECGVWRGGASMYATAVLNAWEALSDRLVHVCDSFEGLPPPRTNKDMDYCDI